MEKQITQTWSQFLTVGISDSKPVIIDWNSEGSYKNTSPANALKKHKEMYPSQSIKVIPCDSCRTGRYIYQNP